MHDISTSLSPMELYNTVKTMIYIELNSRIGNNLFQIACGASLAYKLGCDFAVIPRHQVLTEPDNCLLSEYLEKFRNNLLRKVPFEDQIPEDISTYEEPEYHYIPIPEKAPLFIKGYFQSYKYINEPLIRELFTIENTTLEYIHKKYPFLFRATFTSIHVRRGDYLRYANILPPCSLQYFRDAMSHVPTNNKFFIVSDDISWCKKRFKGDQFYFSENETPLVDLYLQSLCANHIISNSSFAWWGAWLNPHPEKTVIYPKNWFGIFRTANTSDICPNSWIPIENSMNLSTRLLAYYLEFIKRLKAKWERYTN